MRIIEKANELIDFVLREATVTVSAPPAVPLLTLSADVWENLPELLCRGFKRGCLLQSLFGAVVQNRFFEDFIWLCFHEKKKYLSLSFFPWKFHLIAAGHQKFLRQEKVESCYLILFILLRPTN